MFLPNESQGWSRRVRIRSNSESECECFLVGQLVILRGKNFRNIKSYRIFNNTFNYAERSYCPIRGKNINFKRNQASRALPYTSRLGPTLCLSEEVPTLLEMLVASVPLVDEHRRCFRINNMYIWRVMSTTFRLPMFNMCKTWSLCQIIENSQ